MTREHQIICVLGMHRAGTSALTRLLNLGGAALGPDSEVGHSGDDNPTGFWEVKSFRQLNDELLERLGGSWTRPPFPPDGWAQDPGFDDLLEDARELARKYFGDAPLWAWKDPRASITLPFWKRLFPRQKLVLCVRNPLAVAASLEQRNGLSRAAGMTLWFDYIVGALRHSEGCDRAIVHYEDVLRDWSASYIHVVDTLHLRGMAQAGAIRARVEGFLKPQLNHHRLGLDDVLDADDGSYPCSSLYALLARSGAAAGDPPWELLSKLARQAHDDERSRRRSDIERLVACASASVRGVVQQVTPSPPGLPAARLPRTDAREAGERTSQQQ